MSVLEARAEEAEEVVEAVAVACGGWLRGEDLGAVAMAAKSYAVASCIADGLHLRSGLAFAGVEWRIDVDKLCRFCRYFC